MCLSKKRDRAGHVPSKCAFYGTAHFTTLTGTVYVKD